MKPETILRPLVLLMALSGCDELGEPAEDTTLSGHRGESTDEESQYQADMAFFAARRDAYEKYGRIPTVPPSLSSDPNDPTYRFAGYMRTLTAAEEESERIRLANETPTEPTREEEAANDRPLESDEVVAVLVNNAGETWEWRPTDLGSRLERRRRVRGDPAVRSADASDRGEEVEVDLRRNILGSDNRAMRSAFSGHDMTAFPWRANGSLETNGKPTDQQPLGRCTAAKVGERHLLTAAHCVFSEGGGVGSLKQRDWWPGADGIWDVNNGGDPTPNGYKNIEWYVYSKYYVENGWDTRDYAVLVLYDNQSSCNFGAFGYRVDGSLAGTDHWNFGYPFWDNRCPDSSPIAGDLCSGSMWGMEAEIDSTSASYVFFDHDTQEGQSGSPIYDYNGGNRQIVAHVKGTWTQYDNRGIKMRNRVFDFIEAARDEYDSSYCSY